jgi:hypothetical protein
MIPFRKMPSKVPAMSIDATPAPMFRSLLMLSRSAPISVRSLRPAGSKTDRGRLHADPTRAFVRTGSEIHGASGRLGAVITSVWLHVVFSEQPACLLGTTSFTVATLR